MKHLFALIFLLSAFEVLHAQVGINTTNPHPSAALHIDSQNSGLLIPTMSESQRNSIASPAEGLMIYQSNGESGFYYYTGSQWVPFSGESKWIRNGAHIHNDNAGNVGVGTSTPTNKLHVMGTGNLSIPLNTGFENQTLSPLSTSGHLPWEVTNVPAEVNSGSWAARTNHNLSHNESSTLEFSATLNAPGTISFALATSTENNFDWLTFYINGVQQNRWSGGISWRTVNFPLFAGTNVVRWTYSKDGSVNSGLNRVAIDDIVIRSGNPTVRIEDGSQQAGYVLTSDAQGNAF